VAEELLDRPQVGSALEQVRGERMPKPMWVGQKPAQRRGVERPAAHREEEGVHGAPRELRASPFEVETQPVSGLLAERHSSLLPALAADEDELLLEVHVGQAEIHGFLRAQDDPATGRNGGTEAANLTAAKDAWPRTIAFLKRTLGAR